MRVLRLIGFAVIFLCLSAAELFPGDFEEGLKDPLLRKAWEEMKLQKYDEVIGMLGHKTSELASAAEYHFILARAFSAKEKHLEAMQHFRLAYIYFPKGEMKELSLISKAEAYLKLRNFNEAANDFGMFIASFKESKNLIRAKAGLVSSLVGSGRPREALAELNRLQDNTDVLYTRANLLQRLGMHREAYDAYKAAIAKDPSYISKRDDKTHFAATDSADPYKTLAPDNEDTLCLLGENYRVMGEPAAALKYLSMVSSSPHKERASVSLGMISLAEGKTDKAAALFAVGLGSAEREVKRLAMLRLAEAEFKLGKKEEAKVRLNELRMAYPYTAEYDHALLLLADQQAADGNPEEAVKLLRELIIRKQPLPEALDRVVSILRSVREKKENEKLAKLWGTVGAWLLDNTREKFLADMSEALRGSGKPYFDIVRWLVKNGSEQTRTRALVSLASFYFGVGDEKRAKEALASIKNRKGLEDEILRLEAENLLGEKKYRAAAEKYSLIAKYSQSDLRRFSFAVVSAEEPGRFYSRFEKAVAVASGDAASFADLADMAYALGKKKEALKYYKNALVKEPANAWCLYRVASLSEGAEAEALLKKAASGTSASGGLAAGRLREIGMANKYRDDGE